jgi:polyhydroxyalkanoate synthase
MVYESATKYQSYFDEYQKFIDTHNVGENYLSIACNKTRFSKICNILQYQTTNCRTEEIFLIVPSIFNSPEIFFINIKSNFIDHLKECGEVFLIEWNVIDDQYHSLNDYVLEVTHILEYLHHKTHILEYLHHKTDNKINLIGHCIGANIALAAATIKESLIKHLTLLTMIWDCSHFAFSYQFYHSLTLDSNLKNMTHVSKTYIQILFFLLFPDNFSNKVDKYLKLCSNTLSNDVELFFKVEHWLMSGIAIPTSTYFQIIEEMLESNNFMQMKWMINTSLIDPSKLTVPICLIIAKNDRIAPLSSVATLHKTLKNSTIIQMEHGHINYLISSNITFFFQKYKSWLKENL